MQLGPKITCLFYADDGLILAKDKEKAERSIEIIREIGGKYGLQLNERKSQCILFNMKEKYEKISNIEVVEEIKYLGVIVQAKRNVFEGQKNEIMKKIKRLSVMTNSVIEKSCQRVMMGKTYWKGVVLPSALYGAEVIDMKAEEIDKLQKAENTAMRRILKAPKWTAQAAIRGEIGISNMKARIARSRLLYLRRIETGNNEVLKRILEDSKKHKKSKWWETTRKYMNWAQIEEREIKEKTAKEIRGKIAKVVEEEWREEMEKNNSLRIYRRFKKEMKEEDYSGSRESMVWLRARTNSLNLGENSWQRNRDVCVGCSEERETLEHFMLHCPMWEEWRIESRSLQRPRIEETDQVLGEFLFGGHKNNTKKRTLLKMWNERQRLIRNNQENAET